MYCLARSKFQLYTVFPQTFESMALAFPVLMLHLQNLIFSNSQSFVWDQLLLADSLQDLYSVNPCSVFRKFFKICPILDVMTPSNLEACPSIIGKLHLSTHTAWQSNTKCKIGIIFQKVLEIPKILKRNYSLVQS